jgi:hypothetical protein
MTRFGNGLKLFTAGFLVLLFWAILLFWADLLCRLGLVSARANGGVRVFPLFLMNTQRTGDSEFRSVYLRFDLDDADEVWSEGLGEEAWAPFANGKRFVLDPIGWNRWNVIQYNSQAGLFEYRRYEGSVREQKGLTYYIGPQGIHSENAERVGRFCEPYFYKDGSASYYFYDRILRQFFRLSLGGAEPQFYSGPVLDDSNDIVQFGLLQKGRFFKYQEAKQFLQTDDEGRWEIAPSYFFTDTGGPYLFVLDRAGRILRLNKATLCLEGPAGRLPSPLGLFRSQTEGRPEKLSAYRVYPFYQQVNKEIVYLGCCAVSISPEGLGLAIQCFDAEGHPERSRYEVDGFSFAGKSKEVFLGYREDFLMPLLLERGEGALGAVFRFFVDSLQPAVFQGLSFVFADQIEPRAGFRALFLRPHSFIGILRRVEGLALWEMLIWVFLMLLPSLVVGLAVGLFLSKRSCAFGGSREEGRFWLAGGLLFGIPIWIAFHLVRPREKMVTCLNCGSLRRPSQLFCHTCRAGWDLEGLEAPNWCVAEPVEEAEVPSSAMLPVG